MKVNSGQTKSQTSLISHYCSSDSCFLWIYLLIHVLLKADLDGTTFTYDSRMQFLEHVLLASCKKLHTTLIIQHCLCL